MAEHHRFDHVDKNQLLALDATCAEHAEGHLRVTAKHADHVAVMKNMAQEAFHLETWSCLSLSDYLLHSASSCVQLPMDLVCKPLNGQ